MARLSTLRQDIERQQGTLGLDSADVVSIAGSGVSVFDSIDDLPATEPSNDQTVGQMAKRATDLG